MLSIQRDPTFHQINTIIPAVVMTCFAFISFALPSGERISLCINLLVALTFINISVSESIPVNSDFTPTISQLLITCTVLVSAAVFCNVLAHLLRFHGHVKVPRSVRFIIFKVIAPCVGFNQMRIKKRARFFSSRTREAKIGITAIEHCNMSTVRAVQYLVRVTDKQKETEIKDFWRCIGQTMDRFFLILFSILFLLSFISMIILKGQQFWPEKI